MEKNEESKVEEVKEEIHEEQSAPTQQVSAKKPGLYTAGLVCSIVGLCLFWSTWVGIICGVLGIVFGAVTFSKTNNKIPIILGSIATGLAIIMMIVYSVVGAKIYNNFKEDAKDIFNEIEEKYNEEMDNALEEQKNYKEEQSEKDAEFEQKVDEENQNVDSVQEDMNASMDELEKKMNDAFNNITN